MLWLVKLGDATGTIAICSSCEVASEHTAPTEHHIPVHKHSCSVRQDAGYSQRVKLRGCF